MLVTVLARRPRAAEALAGAQAREGGLLVTGCWLLPQYQIPITQYPSLIEVTTPSFHAAW
jgi:hypothetical protein